MTPPTGKLQLQIRNLETALMLSSITFAVTGQNQLACEGCEQRLERTLIASPGIRQAQADARKQRVVVLFDSEKIDAAAIAERIDATGYETRIVNPAAMA